MSDVRRNTRSRDLAHRPLPTPAEDRAKLQEVKHLPELAIALDALFESTQKYSWARRQRRNPLPPPAYQPTGQEGTEFRSAVARAEELEATTLPRSVREAAQGYISVCKERVDPVDEHGDPVDEWDLIVRWHDGRKAAKDKIGERLRTIYGGQP